MGVFIGRGRRLDCPSPSMSGWRVWPWGVTGQHPIPPPQILAWRTHFSRFCNPSWLQTGPRMAKNRVPAHCLGCCVEGRVFTFAALLQCVFTAAKKKTVRIVHFGVDKPSFQEPTLNETICCRNCPISVLDNRPHTTPPQTTCMQPMDQSQRGQGSHPIPVLTSWVHVCPFPT